MIPDAARLADRLRAEHGRHADTGESLGRALRRYVDEIAPAEEQRIAGRLDHIIEQPDESSLRWAVRKLRRLPIDHGRLRADLIGWSEATARRWAHDFWTRGGD